MSSQEQKEMKVKFIVTKFVETDEAQFKSVVQSLTGKDAVTAEADAGDGGAGEGSSKKKASRGVMEDRRKEALNKEKTVTFDTECSTTMDELFDLLGD